MPSWLTTVRKTFKKFFAKFYFIKKIFKQKKFANFLGVFKKKNGFVKQDELDKKIVSRVSKKRWPSFKQLKYLGQVLEPTEKTKVKIFSIILVVCLVALFINVYFNSAIVPKNGGNYTEGLVGNPKFINPLYASLNQVDSDLSKFIYSGLVRIDNELNLVPDLAEDWFVSEDQKSYTFTLKPDLKWHDGEPLTIYDVLFTFEAILNPEFKSPLAQNFEGVTIEQVSDTAVRFILEESYSPFLENLTVGILPEHLWQEVTPANAVLADYNLRPIGSGPFIFKSLIKDKLGNIKSYTLARNKNYYKRSAYLDELIFKFYPDFETATEALKNHNIDGLSYLPKELKENLNSRKDLTYYSMQLPQYTALFFNQTNNPVLKSLAVRKALAYALDKTEIINSALQTEGQAIDGPILPGFIGYNPNIAKYGYDPEKATALLDEAGYVQAEGESYRKNGETELKVILTTVNKGENYLASQVIQKMWQAIGVKVEINLVDPGVIKADVIKNRNFEILLFGEIVGIDPDPYAFWHSSQAGEAGLNLANYINREADKVISEARQISDPQSRHDKYIHFQNILNADLPAIFLYTPKYLYPMASFIKGIDTQNISTPTDRFSNIINWYIKTRRAIGKSNK